MCAHDGILFVRVKSLSGHHCKDAGDASHAELAEQAIKMCELEFAAASGGDKTGLLVKVVLDKRSLEVCRFKHCYVMVCYESGSKSVKSLQRMIRRVARAYKAEPIEPMGAE